ncbi:DUF2059 domain-containing protein [uncultured Alistipes sp.]|jgi:hypothetical protein|uniref:DUF2059 domain-containing protein n=1 Tax=uncultured Alistipes sp. TaxID=538949 RepID=UPI0025FAB5A1|nr:DUF2059 domain-containing protein [uncultured Alistipes sp.]
MKKLICLAVCIAFAGTIPARAQGDEYREAVAKMMDLSGSLAAADVMLDQMGVLMKQSYSSVPDEMWDRAMVKLGEKIRARMVDIYVPIYRKYMTLDDINELCAIYGTPSMRKMIAVAPSIMQEGMSAGAKLGEEVVAELQQELAAEGYQF